MHLIALRHFGYCTRIVINTTNTANYNWPLTFTIREIYWTWAIAEKFSGEVDAVGEVGEGNGESPSTFDTENLVDFVDWNLF